MYDYAIKCNNLEVIESSNGIFIGSKKEDGSSNCRVTDYYDSRDQAQEDLENRIFIVRECLGGCNYCSYYHSIGKQLSFFNKD